MVDTTNGNGTVSAKSFLKGIPSATIYGLLGVVASGLAVTVGFIPTLINAAATQVVVGGLLFIAELVSVAIQ